MGRVVLTTSNIIRKWWNGNREEKIISAAISHIQGLSRFYRLPALSSDQIRNLLIRSTQKEIASFREIGEFQAPESQSIPSSIFDAAQKKILYQVDASRSLDHHIYSLVHEYLHFASFDGGRLGIMHNSGIGSLLNEGLTEYLNLHFWNSLSGRQEIKTRSGYDMEVKIIDMLVKKWGIKLSDLADAYFNGGFQRFVEIVDAKLGDGAAGRLAFGMDNICIFIGVVNCYEAVLITKYGIEEAEQRIDLLVENWVKYSPSQREMVMTDINQLDIENPISIYNIGNSPRIDIRSLGLLN